MKKSCKIIVGLSGGVDSAVTAGLLIRQGWEVHGVFLCLVKGSLQEQHAHDAKKIAEHFNIPFDTMDISGHFEKTVLKPFIREYLNGRTPNPCILCNPLVKFHALLKEADKKGANKIATGHYVRVLYNDKTRRWQLRRGGDRTRDQSYFLARLPRLQLSSFLAPLGEFSKQDVHKLAKEMNLDFLIPKPSSQEICFIRSSYREFLQSRLEVKKHLKPGDIVDKKGQVLGTHKGLAFYTIGQREGLGISFKHPLYVIKIDSKKNQLVVGASEDRYSSHLFARDLSWIAFEKLTEPIRAEAQIRYRKKASPALVMPKAGDEIVEVRFDEPQLSITPGQSCVFYEKDTVLGIGTIL